MRVSGRYAALWAVVGLVAVGAAGCGGSNGSSTAASRTSTVTVSSSSAAKVATPAPASASGSAACMALKADWAAAERSLHAEELGAASNSWDAIGDDFAGLGLAREARLSHELASVLLAAGENPAEVTPHVVSVLKRAAGVLRVEGEGRCGQLP